MTPNEALIYKMTAMGVSDPDATDIFEIVAAIAGENYDKGYNKGLYVLEQSSMPHEAQIRSVPFDHDVALAESTNGYVNDTAA